MSVHVLTVTAWSMTELRARTKAQGCTVVEASFSRLTGWTARTAPLLPARSRTYRVSSRDDLTGHSWEGTVTLSREGGVYVGAVNGVPCAFGEAAARLDTCTHLRLLGETVARGAAA